MNARAWGTIAAIAMSLSTVLAQQQVAEVGQVVRNSGLYGGKSVAVRGVVRTVKSDSKVFTLVDPKSASNTLGTDSLALTVSIPDGKQMALPKPGEEVVVIGQVEGSAKLIANQILTNKKDVQRVTNPASEKRKKHPADNLGKDAPGGDISQ
jgi:hypothetical protein